MNKDSRESNGLRTIRSPSNDRRQAPKIDRAEIRMATLAFWAQHRNGACDDACEA